MLQKPYKFLIVGLGEIAIKSHIPAIEQLGGTYVAAKTEEEYDELLKDPSIDVVSICTPNYLHVSETIKALDAGKKVILEKPVATNVKDAELLLQHPKVFNVAVCYQRRFNSECDEIKRLTQNDKIIQATATVIVRRDAPYWATWRKDEKKSGGGSLMNIAIHYLDLLQWWIGDKYTIKFAKMAKRLGTDQVVYAEIDFNGVPVKFFESSIHTNRNIIMNVTFKKAGNREYTIDDATHFDVYDNFLNKDKFVSVKEAIKSLKLVLDIYAATQN